MYILVIHMLLHKVILQGATKLMKQEISLHLQAGVEQVIEPQLYNQGIIRVCATENPGKQVDARGQYDMTNSTFNRWKEVGYCDDLKIKCWLDSESVKKVKKDKD